MMPNTHGTARPHHPFATPLTAINDSCGEAIVHARDGFPLRASHVLGHDPGRETIALVNALGMPAGTLARLGRALASAYDVVTWESRGAPWFDDAELDPRGAEFVRHVEDLEDVLAHYGKTRVHLVGWCTGADVALEFARFWPDRVVSLICLNGSFVGLSEDRLPFQDNLLRMVQRVADNPAQAELYHALIARSLQPAPTPVAADAEAQSSVATACAHLDPELVHLTSAPLRCPEALQRYFQLLDHYLKEAPQTLPSSPIPTLMVTYDDDAITHPGATRRIAHRLPRARLRAQPTGGHFAPCKDDELIRDIVAFVNTMRPTG